MIFTNKKDIVINGTNAIVFMPNNLLLMPDIKPMKVKKYPSRLIGIKMLHNEIKMTSPSPISLFLMIYNSAKMKNDTIPE